MTSSATSLSSSLATRDTGTRTRKTQETASSLKERSTPSMVQSQSGCPGTDWDSSCLLSIPPYMRRTEGTENTVVDLFNLGLTNSEIAEAVDRMYGTKVSRSTVSNITNRIISSIESFKSRQLASEYAVIYIDATMMALRRDTVQGGRSHCIGHPYRRHQGNY